MPFTPGQVRGKFRIPLAVARKSGGRRSAKPVFEPGRFLTEHAEKLTPEQLDFGKAMDRYKRKFRRPFPTYSQILDVVYALGYRPVAAVVEV